MSWYPCCCPYDPPPCSNCTADLDNVQVEISGITADLCYNCPDLDGTYTLTRTGANACIWTGRWYSDCYLPGGYRLGIDITLESRPLTPSSNKGWVMTINIGVPGTWVDVVTYRWNSGSSSDFDCTTTRSLTYYAHVPDPFNPVCDGYTALTITVNP